MTNLEGSTRNGGYFKFDQNTTTITFFDGSTHSMATGHLMDVQFMNGTTVHRYD